MRIIAGEARGRPILTPGGVDTRPTLDRVRESLFGILQTRMADAIVLDLFAGSGSLGLEALSRGARLAVFNDNAVRCAALIRKNLAALGFEARAEVLCMDAVGALYKLKRAYAFDIVFLDPPYARGVGDILEELACGGYLSPGAVVVVEHGRDMPPPESAGALMSADRRKYGDTLLRFYEIQMASYKTMYSGE